MLFYGSLDFVYSSPKIKYYNLTSLKEGFYRLNYMIPPNSLGKLMGKEFDMAYAQYVFANDLVFKEFFDIIYDLYLGYDVFIIIDENSEWSVNLTESLMKLIQQRYGYNAYHICAPEDIDFAYSRESDFDRGYGILNLDQDKERYSFIISHIPGVLETVVNEV